MKKNLRVHYFQHIAGEGFGSFYDFLKQHDAVITATEFFALPIETYIEIEALPAIEEVDLLIIMGGKMSVHDEALYPWLKVEKRWLRRYLAQKKPVLGLCLGGQLIANALGGYVGNCDSSEVGWIQVVKVNDVGEPHFNFPKEIQVISWHKQYFEIPKGAVQLASSIQCRNQAFQIGHNVLGFQFHPEITASSLKLFLDDEADIGTGMLTSHEIDDLEKTILDSNFWQGHKLVEDAISFVVRDEL